MTPTLLLLDTAPLRDFAQGRAVDDASGQAVHHAWLRDRCVFSPISLLTHAALPPDDFDAIPCMDRLRETLLGMGLIEINVSWDTLRESRRFHDLPPFSYPWFLAGIASHLDATLITDCPMLLRPLARPIRTIVWSSQASSSSVQNASA